MDVYPAPIKEFYGYGTTFCLCSLKIPLWTQFRGQIQLRATPAEQIPAQGGQASQTSELLKACQVNSVLGNPNPKRLPRGTENHGIVPVGKDL